MIVKQCPTFNFVPLDLFLLHESINFRRIFAKVRFIHNIPSRPRWLRSNRNETWKRSSRTRVSRSRTRARLLFPIYCLLIEVLTKTIYLWYITKRRRKVSKGPIKTWSMVRLGTADEVECGMKFKWACSVPVCACKCEKRLIRNLNPIIVHVAHIAVCWIRGNKADKREKSVNC